MKIVKEVINTVALDYVSINELIEVSISRSAGPIFELEDESIVVFTDQVQVYNLMTTQPDIYNAHSNEFNIDNFQSYIINTDEADVIFLNKNIYSVEEYEYSGMPVYRFIVE
jgi:hypothetical protein